MRGGHLFATTSLCCLAQMKTCTLFLVFLVLATVGSAITAEPFTCLAADRSTKTITTSMVDDNYCDCPINGEDEPSTSACAHTVKRFTCVGDVDEKTIPLTFVRGLISNFLYLILHTNFNEY